jgi:hypothetical protein
MECIRGESKLNIKTLNRTLKFSLNFMAHTPHPNIRIYDMNELNNKLQTIQQRINAGERSTASYVLIRRDLWVKLNSGAKNANTIRRLKGK